MGVAGVVGVVGLADQDLVARIGDGGDGEEQSLRPTGRDDDVIVLNGS
jgi:hypothetical protein